MVLKYWGKLVREGAKRMTEKRIATYKAFWPFYVGEHQSKLNRNLHFLGSSLALLCILFGLLFSAWFFLAAPFAGYAFAWAGHFFVEKNRPATFQYPLWSLIADYQMFLFMCMGRMDREVKRMGVLNLE
jgi:hypothetical protein